MAFSLIPDRVYSSIYDIDTELLAESGIRLLLADLDNTLVPYGVADPTPNIEVWKNSLQNSGITLFVLSNNRSATRAKHFSELLGVPFIGHAGKPKVASFYRAMEQMNCTPTQTAMVGDQLYTDILGAKHAGITALLVTPLAWGNNPLRMLRYVAEAPFRAIGRQRNRNRRP